MWKLIIGFIILAAVAMFVLMQGGEIDMTGEKHGAAQPDTNPRTAMTSLQT